MLQKRLGYTDFRIGRGGDTHGVPVMWALSVLRVEVRVEVDGGVPESDAVLIQYPPWQGVLDHDRIQTRANTERCGTPIDP